MTTTITDSALEQIRQVMGENELLRNALNRKSDLPSLWRAIVDHTRGEEMFWLGEILLHEIRKETGFDPHATKN